MLTQEAWTVVILGTSPQEKQLRQYVNYIWIGKKIPVLIATMYQIPDAQFKYQRVQSPEDDRDLFHSLYI